MSTAEGRTRPSDARVLLLDDDLALAELWRECLEGAGHVVEHAASVKAALAALDAHEFDLALLDLRLPDGSGLDVLRRLRGQGGLTESVVLTGAAEVASAVESLKLGAYDYLPKPVDLETFELVVAQALEKRRLRHENRALRVCLEQSARLPGLLTRDRAMLRMLGALERVAQSDLPVVVQGESGTGKELVARAIHRASPRANRPFVAINCAAMPDTLIESELFGYERGAFTGAVERKPGLFEVADKGVLFLDEIGEVGGPVQAKLLRALETREFFRLGGTRAVRADLRFVAATNKDLPTLVAQGRFRDDLYFRLNGVTLRLPALRERPDDIVALALHFLSELDRRRQFSDAALDALRAYAWPGNVRELQMVVRRAVILSVGHEIAPGDLGLTRVLTHDDESGRLPAGLTLRQLERRYIDQVLGDCHGRRRRAATLLGVSVKTLYNKLGSCRGPEPRKS